MSVLHESMENEKRSRMYILLILTNS